MLITLTPLSETSIGSIKVWFHPLKTKVLVDLAGLSPSHQPLNLNLLSKLEDSPLSLNNNSSIVTEPLEIWDVVEVGPLPPSTIWEDLESVPNPLIDMKQETDHAEKVLAPWTLSEFQDTDQSVEDPPALSCLLLTHNQFQYVLMLLHGQFILVVSWLDVLLEPITPSYLPDIPVLIGYWKTLGEADGEKQDISDLDPEMNVVLLTLPFILIEKLIKIK